MREVTGDLFQYPADAIVISINWKTKRSGEAVMGAGVAKQAAERWPWLATSLGRQIEMSSGPAVVCFSTATAFLLLVPTKHDWRAPSTLELVESGVRTMIDLVDRHGWRSIAMPRLGCGLGGLSWSTQVRPLLTGSLDDRFVVCHPGPTR